MRIALIGAGPIAASILQCLVHTRQESLYKNQKLDVVAFDATSNPWTGPAFGPDCDEALCNLHIKGSSLRPWDPEHGARWLEANGYSEFLAPDTYAPRQVIGQYFQSAAAEAIEQLDSFVLIPEYVEEVVPIEDGVRIYTKRGEQTFDAAVLCVGSDTSGRDPYELDGAQGFVKDPYPLRKTVAEVGAEERVGIIGAGLTAVDIVARLNAQGHKGPIALLSRQGLLPAVRRPAYSGYQPQYFTVHEIERIKETRGKLRLADLIELTIRDIQSAGADMDLPKRELFPADQGIDRLRRHVLECDNGDVTYQIWLLQMWRFHEDAWYLLEEEDKRFIRTNFQSIMASLCCPMPYSRAQFLLQLADSGQLSVRDGLSAVSVRDGMFRAKTKQGELEFDRVFSAITETRDQPLPARPMIERLVAAGDVRPHALGGLDVERTTCQLLDNEGRPQPRLYAVGSLISGALELYNGIPLYTKRALQIAETILHEQSQIDEAIETEMSEPLLTLNQNIAAETL